VITYACGRHQTRPSRTIKDRLEPGALDAIAAKFADGIRQVALTSEYGISLPSVKRILHQARRLQNDPSGEVVGSGNAVNWLFDVSDRHALAET
jgi:hypothetical protein